MEMKGERLIHASRERVWEGLNDPETLKACIPGCDKIELLSPTEMRASASVKIGPMSAKFAGNVTLSDLDPPNAYRISGQGQGGAAGFAKGGASVRLTAQLDGTLLSYGVQAQVGGRMAQIGGRLIDATAKSMADQFFTRFVTAVETPAAAAAGPAGDVPAPVAMAPVTRAPGLVARIIAAIRRLLGRKAPA